MLGKVQQRGMATIKIIHRWFGKFLWDIIIDQARYFHNIILKPSYNTAKLFSFSQKFIKSSFLKRKKQNIIFMIHYFLNKEKHNYLKISAYV